MRLIIALTHYIIAVYSLRQRIFILCMSMIGTPTVTINVEMGHDVYPPLTLL
jgi:hypothetical protein